MNNECFELYIKPNWKLAIFWHRAQLYFRAYTEKHMLSSVLVLYKSAEIDFKIIFRGVKKIFEFFFSILEAKFETGVELEGFIV